MGQKFFQACSIVLTVLLCAGAVSAEQVIASDTEIFHETTMYLAESPYIIQGKLTIGSGGRLTIQPGVEVKFDSGAEIIVWHGGQLIARGTGSQMITFKANTDTPSPEYWKQILLYSGGNIFDYVLVRDSENGIYQDGNSSAVTNSHFQDNKFGITLSFGASPEITGNLFEGRNGIMIIGAYHEGQYFVPQPAIHYNTFSGNGFNLYVRAKLGDISAYTIDAALNDWGPFELESVHRLIYDGNDAGNETSPYVNYNTPPQLNPVGHKSVVENNRLTFTVTARNYDAAWDTLTVTASPLPPGATFSPDGDGSGVFEWTPAPDQRGNHKITFTVSDLIEESDMESIIIAVRSL